MEHLVLAVTIFVITFIVIVSEKLPNTLTALFGGLLMVMVGIVEEKKALEAIELDVIFLLVGMMIIVHIMSETGVFQWVAIKIAQLVKGEPFPLLVLLIVITAVFSAFLDNVTTIMLIAPVSMILADQMKLDSIPFIIAEVLASNIGGTATLIGDPPNILIGTAAGISFNEFLVNLGPMVMINLVVLIIVVWFLFGKKLHVSRDLKASIMEIDANRALKEKSILIKSSICMGIVIVGFLTHSLTHIGPSIISLMGAVLLMIIAKQDPEEVFKTVEWKTLFFFIGLFILVEGVVEAGVIKIVADKALEFTNGSLQLTSVFILWLSAVASAIVDNIPYTATLIPMIQDELIPNLTSMNPELSSHTISYALWWSLSMGACLGGNGTLVGASANVVAASIAAKSGQEISFMRFLKYGVLVTFLTVAVGNVYLLIRYL